jgi:hypothetical protein
MPTTARPRKKKTTTTVEEIGVGADLGEDQINELDVSLESVENAETLRDVLQQYGVDENDILFRIYRVKPEGDSFCFESPQLDEKYLQQQRGGGSFKARLFIGGKYKRTISLNVEPPMEANGNGNGHGGSNHEQFLEKLLTILITNQMTHTVSPVAGPTIIDLTQALSNLDNLRGKQDNAMDIFLKGVDLAKALQSDNNGSGDWKTELLKMGRDAIPAITSVVQSRIKPNPPTPIPQPENAAVIDPNVLSDEQKRVALLQGIGYLKQQFFLGLDPEMALNYIVTNAGNPQNQLIIKEILKMKWEEIVALDAEIEQEPFLSAFRSLYDGLRSEFGADDPVGDDPGGIAGDAGDNGNDGKPGKKGK